MGVTVSSVLAEIIMSKASDRFTSFTQSGKVKKALLAHSGSDVHCTFGKERGSVGVTGNKVQATLCS